MDKFINIALDIRQHEVRVVVDSKCFVISSFTLIPETEYFNIPRECLNDIVVLHPTTPEAKIYYLNHSDNNLSEYSLYETIIIAVAKALLEVTHPHSLKDYLLDKQITLAIAVADNMIVNKTTEIDAELNSLLETLCSCEYTIACHNEPDSIKIAHKQVCFIPSVIGLLLNETTDNTGSVDKASLDTYKKTTNLYVNLNTEDSTFLLVSNGLIDDFISCQHKLQLSKDFLTCSNPSRELIFQFAQELIEYIQELLVSISVNVVRIILSGNNVALLKTSLLDAYSTQSPFIPEEDIVVEYSLNEDISKVDPGQFANVLGVFKYMLGKMASHGGFL